MVKSLIACILVACLVVSAAALTMKVEPKTEECFSENLVAGDDVEVRWGVQDGGLLDIDVRVRLSIIMTLIRSICDFSFDSLHRELTRSAFYKIARFALHR